MRQTPWKEASLSQEKKVAVLRVSRALSVFIQLGLEGLGCRASMERSVRRWLKSRSDGSPGLACNVCLSSEIGEEAHQENESCPRRLQISLHAAEVSFCAELQRMQLSTRVVIEL